MMATSKNLTSILAIVIGLVAMYFPVCGQDESTPADNKVFSGPQIGEALPAFTMKYGIGDKAGTEVNLIDQAGNGPITIVFVHKRSRPAFGLANAIMKYCVREGGDQLTYAICFLTDDPTDTQNWMGKIKNYFPNGVPVGFSTEGIEGPGAYGLNRNVELTVVVAKQRVVTANFALVQPGTHVDGPKILSAVASAVGAEGKPDINKYLPTNQAAQDAPIAIDPGLRKQFRTLIAKDASEAAVGAAIEEMESMIKDNKPLQQQLGTLLAGLVRRNAIDNIGSSEQQVKLQEWAKQFAPRMNRRMNQRDQADSRLGNLLRQVIQKSNTDEQVDAAVKAVNEYVIQNPEAARELARITNTIANSDKLSNYGTPYAQEKIQAWAEKYKMDNQ